MTNKKLCTLVIYNTFDNMRMINDLLLALIHKTQCNILAQLMTIKNGELSLWINGRPYLALEVVGFFLFVCFFDISEVHYL